MTADFQRHCLDVAIGALKEKLIDAKPRCRSVFVDRTERRSTSRPVVFLYDDSDQHKEVVDRIAEDLVLAGFKKDEELFYLPFMRDRSTFQCVEEAVSRQSVVLLVGSDQFRDPKNHRKLLVVDRLLHCTNVVPISIRGTTDENFPTVFQHLPPFEWFQHQDHALAIFELIRILYLPFLGPRDETVSKAHQRYRSLLLDPNFKLQFEEAQARKEAQLKEELMGILGVRF